MIQWLVSSSLQEPVLRDEASASEPRKQAIEGDPDPAHISTSFAERSNLSMRTFMRRFTRLALGFSKKFENHCHMVALYAVWYNFVKMHKTLKMTPAMAAGVSDRLWSVDDIAS